MGRERDGLAGLRTFETVARQGSVRKAADELCVTAGAISQQLVTLEGAIGMPLFVREARRLQLTDDGRRLAARLGHAFEQIDAALADFRASAAPGKLRLRITPTMASRWFMSRLADFAAGHPALQVELSTAVDQGTSPLLDGVDFAVRLVQDAVRTPDVLPLFADVLSPVCTPQLARRLQVPSDLASVPLLHSMLRPESWALWVDSFPSPPSVEHGARFATADLAYQAAVEGVGVAIGQLAYLQSELRDGTLVKPFAIDVSTGLSYCLISSSHKRDWPKIGLFRNWMTARLDERA